MAKKNCWICGSESTQKVYQGTIKKLDSSNLQVTDAEYGQTLSRWQCSQCEFQFCPDAQDPAAHYANMVDHDYEETRAPRARQARKLVQYLCNSGCEGNLLDVGSGSGILLEQAAILGLQATGIEPSKWLANIANSQGYTTHCGILPHTEIDEKFNAISCIDVIEHVDNPIEMLDQIAALLSNKGKALLVTPDVDSFAAKIMRSKWWHYRVAHIGYFNKANFKLALERCGLKVLEMRRPTWYFSVDYLIERLAVYMPLIKKLPTPVFLTKIVIPLNLFDSWMVLVVKENDDKL